MPIVEAAGTAVGSKDQLKAKDIEQAMSAAIVQAMEDGITDPVLIRERMEEARQKVKLNG